MHAHPAGQAFPAGRLSSISETSGADATETARGAWAGYGASRGPADGPEADMHYIGA